MIAGIILAAGASSRMGSPKALLDYRGETFVDRLIRVLGSACDPVIVVLGYHAEAIRRAAHRGAQFVLNPDPDRGQLSSLQTGLAEVPMQAEGFMFIPVDCPAVELETVRNIAAVYANRDPETLLVIPRFEEKRGHPVCASSCLIPEFLALPASGSAKEIIHNHRDRTVYIDTGDSGVLADIDDLEAYRKLQPSL